MDSALDLGFLVGERLKWAVRETFRAMPEDVKAERQTWCERMGRDGVRVVKRPEGLYVLWADAPLAFLPAELFSSDSLLDWAGIVGVPVSAGASDE